MLGRISYMSRNAGASGTSYANLCRDLAIVNGKNYEHTDRKGHVKGYLCNIEVVGGENQLLLLNAPSNTWRMRNSFRKFHAYRELMFENAGVSKEERGRYGHTLRPYFDVDHKAEELLYDANPSTGDILVPGLSGASANGGEWTYSKLAAVPLYTFEAPTMGTSTLKVADEYPLLVCGQNVEGTQETGTSGQYSAVGMIHSYNLDRQDVVTPTLDGETIDGPKNPLAALIASGNQAAGEILEITNDLELEKPPYDIQDGGDSVKYQMVRALKTPTTLGVVRGQVFIPCGLVGFVQSIDSAVQINIDVIAEVLCKDMA
jgi:hypothetical protein